MYFQNRLLQRTCSAVGVVDVFLARQADVSPGQLRPYCATIGLQTFK